MGDAVPQLEAVKIVQAGNDQAAADFSAVPGSSVSEKVDAAVAGNAVCVCPFSIEISRTFTQMGVPHTLFQLDQMPNGGEVHKVLKQKYSQTTVPYVFVGQEFLGGCDSTKALQRDGSLVKKLQAAGVKVRDGARHHLTDCGVPEGHGRVPSTLFAFPEVADDRMARVIAFLVFVCSLLSAIYYRENAGHWLMGGVMIDFCCRFAAGGTVSPLGGLAAVVVAVMDMCGSKPRFVPGVSKQFATLCGIMFAGLSFFFYLLEEYNWKTINVGLAMACMLGAAATLEWALGFCLACWMFGLGIQFGLLPPDMYSSYSNSRAEAEYTFVEMNKQLNEGEPPKHVKHFDDTCPLQIDYKYTAKTDDMTREDFHLIKHVKITHTIAILGSVGLACAWKVAAFGPLVAPRSLLAAIGIGSAAAYVIWLGLYLIKMVKYPQKVLKEWQCPLRGNNFVLPFIILVLFAFLIMDHTYGFATVLFWIGAPTSLALSLIRVGDWVATRKDLEHINGGWMIMPVANAISALVGPILEPKYLDAMQFWYAVAFVMWAVLFVITFYKTIVKMDEDDRVRPTYAIWIAAPAVLGVAYLSCWPATSAIEAGATGLSIAVTNTNSFIYINFHWISVAMTLILLWCFYRPYFGRIRFDFSYWSAGFPSDALAITCMYYQMQRDGPLARAIAITALSAATAINVTLAFLTLAAVLRKRIFVPDPKWGPLSFMRLTHEAIRDALPRLMSLLDVPEGATLSDLAIESLAEQWQALQLVHDEHSVHEDRYIFKTYNDFFPHVADAHTKEHADHHEVINRVSALIQNLASTKNPAAVPELRKQLAAYSADLLAHLRGEEDHLQALPRKHMNLTLSKSIVTKCWEHTPAEKWFVIIPWVVNHLPMLHQRVRFLKSLLWAMPERAQQIGIMVALGVDGVQWLRITNELPDIIPRGAVGWERYY